MHRGLTNAGYVLRRMILARLRWRTLGVKVMAFDADGRLLLVRHNYGRSDLWMLPGGGVGWREEPVNAARRELREEVGCELRAVSLIGRFRSAAEGRRDTILPFRGQTSDNPAPDGWEIAEAGFFALRSLPAETSPATRRRVAELEGGRLAQSW